MPRAQHQISTAFGGCLQDSTPSALEEGSTPVAKDPDSGALPTSAAEDVTSLQAELELSKTQVETLLARQAASEDKIAFLTMNNKSLVDEVLGLKEEARRLHVPVGCAEDVCGTNVASDSNDKVCVCVRREGGGYNCELETQCSTKHDKAPLGKPSECFAPTNELCSQTLTCLQTQLSLFSTLTKALRALAVGINLQITAC